MKKTVFALVALVIVCSIILCGCSNKSRAVGVWRNVVLGNYMYVYEGGTYDFYDPSTSRVHYESATWQLNGDTFIRHTTAGVDFVFTISNGKMINQDGKVSYEKVTGDTSQNIK